MLTPAPVCGLVLAGGFSTRLGRDKGLIPWHGKPQRLHLLELLQQAGLRSFLSVRPGQMPEIETEITLIPDRYGAIGPAGAILSAMDTNPACAWLVMACDLPLMNAAFLSFLLENRDPEAMFTGCANAYGLEPLAAIWEPSARPVFAESIQKGEYSIQNMMRGRRLKLLSPPAPEVLLNVNTQGEFEEICHILDTFENNEAL